MGPQDRAKQVNEHSGNPLSTVFPHYCDSTQKHTDSLWEI